MRVIIDVNIWISYCIGQMLDDLLVILSQDNIQLFTCFELNSELAEVSGREKLKKYIKNSRLREVFELMENYCSMVKLESRTARFQDVKDNYLLDLCNEINADYLVTGDQLLLALGEYSSTKIISYRDFRSLIIE